MDVSKHTFYPDHVEGGFAPGTPARRRIDFRPTAITAADVRTSARLPGSGTVSVWNPISRAPVP